MCDLKVLEASHDLHITGWHAAAVVVRRGVAAWRGAAATGDSSKAAARAAATKVAAARARAAAARAQRLVAKIVTAQSAAP